MSTHERVPEIVARLTEAVVDLNTRLQLSRTGFVVYRCPADGCLGYPTYLNHFCYECGVSLIWPESSPIHPTPKEESPMPLKKPSTRRPRIEVFPDSKHQYRGRIVAANGEIVLTTEAYTRKSSAKRALERITQIVIEAAAHPIDEVPA